jgi:molybdopterin synthase sulfur carrier subunit
MNVNVEIPTTLRDFTNGRRVVQGAGESLAELLADLDQRHPGLRARLVADDGKLRRFINIYINDNNVRFEKALESHLADGDLVTIIPAVAGGAYPAREETEYVRHR